uniref:E3 ubiquitin-protein ligase synoviolin n=1 Tax=Sus scrofa TaxID=9823 RepID=A0A8D2C5P1_PIG
MFRTAVMMAASLALTGAVVAHAYYLKHQFYPTVVYLTKSSPSMAVLYIQAFVLVFLLGKVMGKVFFGQLRAAEMEHLLERSWYAVTETCLAFTVFRDDFSPRFVALFTLLLFLKCFHWLAEDRVDFMERSPNISWLFHCRIVSLMFLLGILDFLFVSHAYHSILTRGASVQLVFGFEYAILMTMVLTIFIKYVLHSVDLQSENPWDNKAVYMLYTELFTGFIKVLLYMAFMTIMIKVHTFPLFAIRPMYLAMRQFKKAVTDAIMSRRAIRNMNTLYPDATAEELQAMDNVCIICREEMVTGAKRLPCNHIFHTSCLRSWFQRQQTCPTCRMDVLRASLPNQSPPPPEPADQGPPPAPHPPPLLPQPPNCEWPPLFGHPTHSSPCLALGRGDTGGSRVSALLKLSQGGGRGITGRDGADCGHMLPALSSEPVGAAARAHPPVPCLRLGALFGPFLTTAPSLSAVPQGLLPPFPPGMFPLWPPMGPFPPVPPPPSSGEAAAPPSTSAALSRPSGAATTTAASPASAPAPGSASAPEAGPASGFPFPPPWMGMPLPPPFGKGCLGRREGVRPRQPGLSLSLPPAFPPMPVPPAGFAGLTPEELRALEGHERQHLEARLQSLRNIHTLLDAAMLQINQYLTVLASLGYVYRGPMRAGGCGAAKRRPPAVVLGLFLFCHPVTPVDSGILPAGTAGCQVLGACLSYCRRPIWT